MVISGVLRTLTHTSGTFYHHGRLALTLLFPQDQLVVNLSFHHVIKFDYIECLHEIKAVYTYLSTRNQAQRYELVSKLPNKI